jgi:hypothetical protein
MRYMQCLVTISKVEYVGHKKNSLFSHNTTK